MSEHPHNEETSAADTLRKARIMIESDPTLNADPGAWQIFNRFNDTMSLESEDGTTVDILELLNQRKAVITARGAGAAPAEQVVHSVRPEEEPRAELN